eukprot:gene3762-2992_t
MKGSAPGSKDGLSISACREIGLLRELQHENIIKVQQVFVNHESRDVWLLFPYAEYDLWGIITYHHKKARRHPGFCPPPEAFLKSVMWQILVGIHYLHSNWVLHRDLKPANILVMGPDSPECGTVKIADLGMARLFNAPLKPLSQVDPVVVTFWYRAPELLMASKHYTKAVDIWAIGCIMAELMTSKPIFYTKNADKSKDPYHVDQLREIIRIMGCPVSVDGKPKDPSREWQGMNQLPKYKKLQEDFPVNSIPPHIGLETYLRQKSPSLQRGSERTAKAKLKLLVSLLRMDPQLRVSAQAALQTKYFKDTDFSKVNAFEGVADFDAYPKREYKVPEDKGSGKKVGAGVDTSKPFFPEFNPARTPKRFAVADEACESRQKKGKV